MRTGSSDPRLGTRRLGERLLRSPGGPTFAAASRLLPPLLFADGHGGRPLTASGVYYFPFTLPYSVGGPRGLRAARRRREPDLVRRVDGPSLTVSVGEDGDERFGSCLARLQTPRLAEGYLPILQVAYSDGAGVRYRQESFVGRLRDSQSLVSFVRIDADARRAAAASRIELVTSRGQNTVTLVPRGHAVEIGAAFVHAGARLRRIDADEYAVARTSVTSFWAQSPAADAPSSCPSAALWTPSARCSFKSSR